MKVFFLVCLFSRVQTVHDCYHRALPIDMHLLFLSAALLLFCDAEKMFQSLTAALPPAVKFAARSSLAIICLKAEILNVLSHIIGLYVCVVPDYFSFKEINNFLKVNESFILLFRIILRNWFESYRLLREHLCSAMFF